MNDSKTENTVDGDFFLPIQNRFKLLLGGTGEAVWVKSFYAKYMRMEIEDENFVISSDKKNCECCIII